MDDHEEPKNKIEEKFRRNGQFTAGDGRVTESVGNERWRDGLIDGSKYSSLIVS